MKEFMVDRSRKWWRTCLLAVACTLGATGAAEQGADPDREATTLPQPAEVEVAPHEPEPGHDVEGGPLAEGEELRRLTPITDAELNAADPVFRHWVELIHAGRADKRVMRLYWFFRSRLEPFDRLVPEGWRSAGVGVLRDETRNREAAARFEQARGERLASGDDAKKGELIPAPPGSVLDAAGRLRQDREPESSFESGPGVSASGTWVPIGPLNIPGRMTGLDRPANEPLTLYAAAADGGVWRTVDGGATWDPLSDFEATLSGGSILLDPTDPDVIYFGTGEGNGAIDNYPGIGVLKSSDGGNTWTASNEFSSVVRRLAMHPDDPNRLYAAGANGCYKSDDAGATFTIIEGGLPTGTGASDVLVRPDDQNVVFCALWGGSDGDIYRSTDKGMTWSLVDSGLPAPGGTGRIALAVSRSDPDVMIAGIDFGGGTIYKTTNGGDSWTEMPSTGMGNYCGGQCWYDNVVGIDPVNPEILYAGGINTFRSTDGGDNWAPISSSSGGRGGNPDFVHVDQHFIFTPAGAEIILANDGGIYRSTNHGANWSEWSQGMDTTQYYGICRHPTDLDWVFGGTQDNGSHRRRTGDVPEWQQRLGADGGMCMTGPAGSNVVVGEHQNHNMRRSTNDGDSWGDANSGIGQEEPRPWVGILVADGSDRNNMWTGTNRVYRSLDARTSSWVQVSGAVWYGRPVSALEVAPSDSNVVYAGFESAFIVGGGLYVSSDALGASPTWTDIRDDAMPNRSVRRIRVHPDDPNTVYVVFGSFGPGKVWKSTDRGAGWVDRTGDIPDVPINDLLIDADNPGTLLAATDLGVYRSDDDGASWYGFSNGLPSAAAIEFTYDRASGTLRVGTHGRSVWDWQPSADVPTAVPDGSVVGGTPMTAERSGAADMLVKWDVESCTAGDYNLFYGDLGDVVTYVYSDAECGLGTSGQSTVPLPSTPSGNAFFVIVATDNLGEEGPHGYDGDGDVRPADGIGFCGLTSQDPLATCP